MREQLLKNIINLDSSYVEIVDQSEISKNINIADLFITDFSSIAFSFMYLNTPVIFYRLDADYTDEKYKEVEYINYARTKDCEIYNVFYNIDDTIDKVKFYVENNFKLEEEFKDINYKFFDYPVRGKIAEHLLKQLEQFKNKKNLRNFVD